MSKSTAIPKKAIKRATVRIININDAATVRSIPAADGFPASIQMSMTVPDGVWNLEACDDVLKDDWRFVARVDGGSLVNPGYPAPLNSVLYRLVEVPA